MEMFPKSAAVILVGMADKQGVQIEPPSAIAFETLAEGPSNIRGVVVQNRRPRLGCLGRSVSYDLILFRQGSCHRYQPGKKRELQSYFHSLGLGPRSSRAHGTGNPGMGQSIELTICRLQYWSCEAAT